MTVTSVLDAASCPSFGKALRHGLQYVAQTSSTTTRPSAARDDHVSPDINRNVTSGSGRGGGEVPPQLAISKTSTSAYTVRRYTSLVSPRAITERQCVLRRCLAVAAVSLLVGPAAPRRAEA